MTVQRSQITIQARIEEIGQACHFVSEMAEQAGLDSKARHHCQLAIDEACTNIIEHGYGGGSPNHVIEVYCDLNVESFEIIVVDDSPAFNPLNQPAPDPATGIEDRKTGGWGVYFIKQFMDRVAYEYRNGRNHLYMAKILPASKTDKK